MSDADLDDLLDSALDDFSIEPSPVHNVPLDAAEAAPSSSSADVAGPSTAHAPPEGAAGAPGEDEDDEDEEEDDALLAAALESLKTAAAGEGGSGLEGLEKLLGGDVFKGLEGGDGIGEDEMRAMAGNLASALGGLGGSEAGPSGGGNGDGADAEALAGLLARLGGAGGASGGAAGGGLENLAGIFSALGGMGGAGGEASGNLEGMLGNVMNEIVSKELLNDPMQEMRDKYRAWLSEHEGESSEDDATRYRGQLALIEKICAEYERGDDSTKVVGLLQELQKLGAPPGDIVAINPDDVPADSSLEADLAELEKLQESCKTQ